MNLEQKTYNLPEWLKKEMRDYIVDKSSISTTKYYNIIKLRIIKDANILNTLSTFLKIYNCHIDMETLMKESFYLYLINQNKIQKQ